MRQQLLNPKPVCGFFTSGTQRIMKHVAECENDDESPSPSSGQNDFFALLVVAKTCFRKRLSAASDAAD